MSKVWTAAACLLTWLAAPRTAAADYLRQEAKLEVSPAMSRGFGMAVAIEGDTAVVGAPLADTAWVYVRSGGQWTMQANLGTLYSSAWAFGASVAVSGDTIVVGAPNEDRSGLTGPGAAYVFTRSGQFWSQQAKLVASDAAAMDWFGTSVAVSGDTAVVGSPLADLTTLVNAGATYVFTRSGAAWAEQTKLVPSDVAQEDRFGTSVGLSGSLLAVGSINAMQGVKIDAGAVYAYSGGGAIWTLIGKLLATTPDDYARLGSSVCVSGETVVAGAPSGKANGVASGVAYIFAPKTAGTSPLAVLSPSDAQSSTDFGRAVGLSDGLAVVNTAGISTAVDPAGYVFTATGGWTQQEKLVPPTGALGFAVALAVSGPAVLVGSGEAAYLFRVPGGDGTACQLAADCAVGTCTSGTCSSADGGTQEDGGAPGDAGTDPGNGKARGPFGCASVTGVPVIAAIAVIAVWARRRRRPQARA